MSRDIPEYSGMFHVPGFIYEPNWCTRFSRKALGNTRQKGIHSTGYHPFIVYYSTQNLDHVGK